MNFNKIRPFFIVLLLLGLISPLHSADVSVEKKPEIFKPPAKLKMKNLNTSKMDTLKLRSSKKKILFFVAPKCHACEIQVNDFACFKGKDIDVIPVAISSDEKETKKLFELNDDSKNKGQKFPFDPYQLDIELLASLPAPKIDATPKMYVIKDGQYVKAFKGAFPCNDLYNKIVKL